MSKAIVIITVKDPHLSTWGSSWHCKHRTVSLLSSLWVPPLERPRKQHCLVVCTWSEPLLPSMNIYFLQCLQAGTSNPDIYSKKYFIHESFDSFTHQCTEHYCVTMKQILIILDRSTCTIKHTSHTHHIQLTLTIVKEWTIITIQTETCTFFWVEWLTFASFGNEFRVDNPLRDQ